jgi:hypothetical protein
VNRLYISNSKYLFFTIVFFVFCGIALTELYYNYKNSPVDFGISHRNNIKLTENTRNSILIIGDSRAGCAFVPEIIDIKIPSAKTYNPSSRGGAIYGIINNIGLYDKPFKLVVICVSPVSMFGAFAYDSIKNQTKKINLTTPFSGNLYERVNLKLSDLVVRNFKFTYGFKELKNLFLYGNISHYITYDGWESNMYFGSFVRYSRICNYYGYKNRLLCNSGNKEFLEKYKNEFSSLIKTLVKNQKIVLVRLPVSPELRQLENERFPWFDEYILDVSAENKIKYLNNFSDSFMSDPNNDGSHLSHYQAIHFSEMISDTLIGLIIK